MSSPLLSVARRTAIAVDQAERDRARIGLTVAAVIAASGAGIGQLGAGEGPEHWLLTVMLLATAAASAYLALAFRRRRVSSIELRSMGAILSLTALAALAYTGLTGAVAIVLCALV